jgi:predicted phage terminase large subunit-like protein
MRTAKEDIELIRLLELEKAEECRDNFYKFCRYMHPSFFTPDKPHLQEIAEAFQAVADGEIKKLAISEPPRAGKSFETSLWCAWMLGRKPQGSIMRNSYAADLAETFSYDIRQMVQADKYLMVFPKVKLKSDRKAINDWALDTSKRSAYFCAGVGGAITGKGCDIAGILDDPIKNIEEAMSETTIDKVWKWYTSTHLSRFESGCPEIHIATRWSRNDPIGKLTDEFSEAFDKDYTVIRIPALDEYGKSFCEAVRTTEEYHNTKRITDDFIWEAEFMQNPIESKGLLFPVEDLKRFSLKDLEGKKPDGIIGFTDTADKGDDSLCSPVGKRFGDYTYITDVVFSLDPVEITEPLVAQQIIDTKCEWMIIESNNGGRQFARNIRKLTDPKWKCSISDQNETSNKETRILMNSGYIKDYFYFRDDYEPGSDYDKFMRALTSYVKFGKNKHDDAPDGVTGLAEVMRYSNYDKPKPPPVYNFDFERPKQSPLGYGDKVRII